MTKNYLLRTMLPITLIIVIFSGQLTCQDKVHFYSTRSLWPEPRFEKEYLLSFDTTFFAGSTCESRPWSGNTVCQRYNDQTCKDCDKCCVPLLDVYGKHNMHLLGENVPQKDLDLFPDTTLTLLSLIPAREDFGKLSFSGNFRTTQFDMTLTQNFKRGFFATIHLPIRSLEISCIKYKDLSPSGPQIPNKDHEVWKSFLTQFETIMEASRLDLDTFRSTGVGDLSMMIGYAKNYEDTEIFDFVDTTIKAGLLFPSGENKDPDKVFGLPMGYDGHVGVPIAFDISFGLYEWLTLGGHFDILFLLNRNKTLRLKTASQQSGFIKLARGEMVVRPGLVGNTGIYVKADHFAGAFSLWVGYSFAFKSDDKLEPCNTSKFDAFIAGSDEMFRQWKMHTIHFQADYDFTREEKKFGARVGLFYNLDIGGRRTFKTNTVGLTVGFDVTMEY